MNDCPCQRIEIAFEDLSSVVDISLEEISKVILDSTVVVYRATENEWNERTELVSERNSLYIYTDHIKLDGRIIPGIKIGDGKTLLSELPFIADDGIRITNEDITNWDSKWKGSVVGERLVFSI